MSCLHCDLSERLEQTRPPDPEMVDLIEQAFIDGQINRQKVDLAYLFLMFERRSFQAVTMAKTH